MPWGAIMPRQLEEIERSPWSGRRLTLSKSKIAAFEHCAKRLWLQIHRPDDAMIDGPTQLLFEWGHKVGAAACSLHPTGLMVEADPDIAAALECTQRLLTRPNPVPIFEATFQRDDVLIRADILLPESDRAWRLIEVKGATRVKAYQLRDLATQAWTIAASGITLSALTLRHLRKGACLRTDRDLIPGAANDIFVDADVTPNVAPLVRRRLDVISAARTSLRGPEPVRAMGTHCTRPFTCEFAAYCSRAQGKLPLPFPFQRKSLVRSATAPAAT